MKLTIDVEARDGAARTGSITTPRGVLPTPLFMPVGTRAAVKTLDSADLEALGIPLPKDGKAIEDYGNRIFRNPGFTRSLTPQERNLRELPG